MEAKECGQMNQEVKLGYNEKLPATYSLIQAETEAENETSHNESQIREGHIGRRIVHETSHKTYTREIRDSRVRYKERVVIRLTYKATAS